VDGELVSHSKSLTGAPKHLLSKEHFVDANTYAIKVYKIGKSGKRELVQDFKAKRTGE
jgi:hypothetical protein